MPPAPVRIVDALRQRSARFADTAVSSRTKKLAKYEAEATRKSEGKALSVSFSVCNAHACG